MDSYKDKRIYLTGEISPTYFTQRECQCAELVLEGHTAKRIARMLGLSNRTIEYYLHNMKQKLRCKTRLQLVSTLIQTDFIEKFIDKEKQPLDPESSV